MFSPSSIDPAGDAGAGRQQPHHRRGWWSSCRSPTRPPGPSARPGCSSKLTPCTACSSPPPARSNQTCRSSTCRIGWLALTRRPASRAAARTRNRLHRQVADPQPRVERVLHRLADHRAGQDHQRSRRRPGGTIAHQASFSTAWPVKAFSISLPHEIALGSPRPRNAMHGLGEDRERDHQHHVGDQERRHLRQDVLEDQPVVAGAQRPRPLHVDALAHALAPGRGSAAPCSSSR